MKKAELGLDGVVGEEKGKYRGRSGGGVVGEVNREGRTYKYTRRVVKRSRSTGMLVIALRSKYLQKQVKCNTQGAEGES